LVQSQSPQDCPPSIASLSRAEILTLSTPSFNFYLF
jgi:hypothetical protein